MAEKKITSEDEEEKIIEGEDEESKSEKKDSNTTEDKGENDEEKNEEEDENKEDDGKDDDDDDVKVPVRKSALQHIVARQSKTIKKLRSKQEDEGAEGEEEVEEETEDDKKSSISEEVQKQIKPVLNILVGKVDEDELSDLFKDEPDSKKMEKKIRFIMADPHYRGVPPAVIYHHLAFDKAAGVRSNKKKVADIEADQMRSSGRPLRGNQKNSKIPSAADIAEMDDKEFESLQNDVMDGKYKQ